MASEVATAWLFAAAPDLLAACREARDYVSRQRGGCGNLEAVLDAAIARATSAPPGGGAGETQGEREG